MNRARHQKTMTTSDYYLSFFIIQLWTYISCQKSYEHMSADCSYRLWTHHACAWVLPDEGVSEYLGELTGPERGVGLVPAQRPDTFLMEGETEESYTATTCYIRNIEGSSFAFTLHLPIELELIEWQFLFKSIFTSGHLAGKIEDGWRSVW